MTEKKPETTETGVTQNTGTALGSTSPLRANTPPSSGLQTLDLGMWTAPGWKDLRIENNDD